MPARLATATAGEGPRLTVVPGESQKTTMARWLRIKQSAAWVRSVVFSVPGKFMGIVRKAIDVFHLGGVADVIGRVWQAAKERVPMVKDLASAIGVWRLALLAVTSKKGQAAIGWTVNTTGKIVGWTYSKVRGAMSWVLSHLGKPGRAVDNKFTDVLDGVEKKVGGWLSRAKAKVKSWLNPDRNGIAIVREVTALSLGVKLVQMFTPIGSLARLAGYALAIFVPGTGAASRARKIYTEKRRNRKDTPAGVVATGLAAGVDGAVQTVGHMTGLATAIVETPVPGGRGPQPQPHPAAAKGAVPAAPHGTKPQQGGQQGGKKNR